MHFKSQYFEKSVFSKMFGILIFSVSHSTKITQSEKKIEAFLKIKLIIILLYFQFLLSILFVIVFLFSFFTKIISSISYFPFLKLETNSVE